MDKGHRETDRLIDDLEKRIQNVYSRAAKETQEKLDTYMESFKAKDKKKREEVVAGTLSKSDYAKWRTGQIMVGKRWEEMLDTLSTDLANADKLAQSITQGYMYDAYALNHNYATFLVEQESLVDTSYTLYDRQTVERLIKDEPNLLPAPTPGSKRDRELREGRIERWNAQKITSEVTQGILQGESVDKIASRMQNVAAMGSRAARRNARTAVTGAENAGRQAGFERAQDMGIDTEKQWLATMDDRTRHEHRLLDGVHVPVDDDFEVEGYKIEYPGDPSAEPEMVYNCRCTMICRIKGFEKDFTDRHNDALGDMTYEEWKGAHRQNHSSTEDTTNTNQPLVPVIENPKIFRTSKEADEYFRGETYQTKLGGINRTRGYGVREDSKCPATKWANSLTYKQTTAINDYTGAGYAPINSYLRGQWTKQEAKEAFIGQNSLESTIKAIDEGLNKSVTSEPIRVFRTCEADFLDKISVGGIFHDEGYGSTSVLPFPVASGNVFFEIDIPAGKGIGAYVDGLSWKEGEEFEYLINRGANYYINSIEERKGGTYVKATLAGFER
jgi:SPP1 gp7 family putative phage head morphogenesis protein